MYTTFAQNLGQGHTGNVLVSHGRSPACDKAQIVNVLPSARACLATARAPCVSAPVQSKLLSCSCRHCLSLLRLEPLWLHCSWLLLPPARPTCATKWQWWVSTFHCNISCITRVFVGCVSSHPSSLASRRAAARPSLSGRSAGQETICAMDGYNTGSGSAWLSGLT